MTTGGVKSVVTLVVYGTLVMRGRVYVRMVIMCAGSGKNGVREDAIKVAVVITTARYIYYLVIVK